MELLRAQNAMTCVYGFRLTYVTILIVEDTALTYTTYEERAQADTHEKPADE